MNFTDLSINIIEIKAEEEKYINLVASIPMEINGTEATITFNATTFNTALFKDIKNCAKKKIPLCCTGYTQTKEYKGKYYTNVIITE